MKNTHLLSFCAGYKNADKIITRFKSQAEDTMFFDSINIHSSLSDCIFDELDLDDRSFIEKNKRGFGYWLWKPWIIMKTLQKLNRGEYLVYADIGCEFSNDGKDIFESCLQLSKSQGVCAYFVGKNSKEYKWTKNELATYMNAKSSEMHSNQVAATFIYFNVCDSAKRFVADWLRICRSKNYSLLNDNITICQAEGFIEHRHDQSIFSLLYKSLGLMAIDRKCYFSKDYYFKFSPVLKEPIHALRNRGIVPSITKKLRKPSRYESFNCFVSLFIFCFIKFRRVFKLIQRNA